MAYLPQVIICRNLLWTAKFSVYMRDQHLNDRIKDRYMIAQT